MRLDRFLAQASGLSRSQARQLLKQGGVQVDGCVVRGASTVVTDSQQVLLEGERLSLPQFQYLMLNKPQDVVCATRDADHQTVIDLLGAQIRSNPKGELHPAGRLDRDTTGLVLITDDGQWSHNVTSPRKQCRKCYQVQLAEPIDQQEDDIRRAFREGILLNGEVRPTLPAELQLDSPTEVTLFISEGRYHQVKRMFAAVGNRVTALHRQQIGPIELDASLAPGCYRPLTAAEIAAFSH